MGVLHMPTAAGHHPLKSCPRHEAPPQIILKSVTFTMTTESPPRAPPLPYGRIGSREHVHLARPCSLGAPGIDVRVPMGYSEGREVVTSVSALGHVVVHTR